MGEEAGGALTAKEAKPIEKTAAAVRYKELCIALLRTGLVGYGGGPATIPLIRHEAVTRFKWMDDDEFGEVLAIANTLPGPIATKLAAYLGYRLCGWPGGAVGVAAHIVPTGAAMIGLYAFMAFFQSSPIIQGMIAGVVPVVAVMLGVMAYEFGEKAVKGLGLWLGVGLFAGAFALLQLAGLHPAIVIFAYLVYGAFHHRVKARWKARPRRPDREGGLPWNG
ncbi:chromate transporter [Paenibacillus sp. IB182496]|uniref:Chromate transporter n=1 Tax=Paenibacillus sabuli TaxID=2772509 RepID=A0A927GQV1_9BACL|nr:chromate transporter [Paenibacillus sabuli]MBD2844651.1 chromate transporter [Paenibacillus sabuli]